MPRGVILGLPKALRLRTLFWSQDVFFFLFVCFPSLFKVLCIIGLFMFHFVSLCVSSVPVFIPPQSVSWTHTLTLPVLYVQSVYLINRALLLSMPQSGIPCASLVSSHLLVFLQSFCKFAYSILCCFINKCFFYSLSCTVCILGPIPPNTGTFGFIVYVLNPSSKTNNGCLHLLPWYRRNHWTNMN